MKRTKSEIMFTLATMLAIFAQCCVVGWIIYLAYVGLKYLYGGE